MAGAGENETNMKAERVTSETSTTVTASSPPPLATTEDSAVVCEASVATVAHVEAVQPPPQPIEDEEEVVTLHDVLQEQTELDETANAVLGDADDDSCSYEMGYYRQALYACLTCTPGPVEDGNVAGVCLACSYHCHSDHELVELYTKRDFRCDCGNSRFPEGSKCALFDEKEAVNDRNKYSQNFVGTYCACHRPYPDPERSTPEIMVQCIVCEDWLHEEHIFPSSSDTEVSKKMPVAFDELICVACMAKHPFLAAYQQLLETDGDETPLFVGGTVENGQCVLKVLEERQAQQLPVQPTFWSGEWRSRLCPCSKCVARMEKEQIGFLMDPEDSLQAYEARTQQQQQEQQQEHHNGQATTTTTTTAAASSGGADPVVSGTVETAMSSLEQAAQRAFQSKLSHEQQVEMAMGYNHMKSKLQTYLATFAASGKTVRAQDIQEFFEELKETKRQRLN